MNISNEFSLDQEASSSSLVGSSTQEDISSATEKNEAVHSSSGQYFSLSVCPQQALEIDLVAWIDANSEKQSCLYQLVGA